METLLPRPVSATHRRLIMNSPPPGVISRERRSHLLQFEGLPMPVRSPITHLATHEVTNQPPLLEDFNPFETDLALKEVITNSDAAKFAEKLTRFGEQVGSTKMQEWAVQANENPPQHKPYDRYGHRIDEVEFHPAYHALMDFGLTSEICSIAWTAPTGGHSAHAAMMYLMGHADSGVCCPFSMTYAAVPVIRLSPTLAAEWEPLVMSAGYDPRFIPASEKTGVTIGMAMTEKQGGSDVRANTTRATRLANDDEYQLVGHKWFCSAPMSDGFLTLAQAEDGLTCFFVPRWRPDGTRNAIHVARLKDKLGDHSNASSEIEYQDAWAQRVGEEGRGVRTIIDMVQGTRLDCTVGSAGIMRAALTQALWHTDHRSAFQKKLIDQPAMRQTLADLIVETEAATALAFRVAQSFDKATVDDGEAAFKRLTTPVAKYWICKRAPGFVYEAMECHGGAGYVEENPLPRLFRQSPLNSIWEGSGNVIALDALRAIAREPEAIDVLLEIIEESRGAHNALDRAIDALKDFLRPTRMSEVNARLFVEQCALTLQGALLTRSAPNFVSDAFCTARLQSDRALMYGTGALEDFATRLIERSML